MPNRRRNASRASQRTEEAVERRGRQWKAVSGLNALDQSEGGLWFPGKGEGCLPFSLKACVYLVSLFKEQRASQV